ncbi:MAG: type II toxin-antitoxin system RelE/ParE family toxin [Gammaproteobacteria bacterium]|nr:MAG: type II toxin-antitoxin system RelE/ParE family toxin [Gammaproteobacteria bacterium]
MIIKWLDDAIDDLQALRQYIAQDKPSAANRVAKRILSAVNLLPQQPGIGRPGRIPGTRELIVANTPYIIPYRIRNQSIEILRVLHAAIQWPEEINIRE